MVYFFYLGELLSVWIGFYYLETIYTSKMLKETFYKFGDGKWDRPVSTPGQTGNLINNLDWIGIQTKYFCF